MRRWQGRRTRAPTCRKQPGRTQQPDARGFWFDASTEIDTLELGTIVKPTRALEEAARAEQHQDLANRLNVREVSLVFPVRITFRMSRAPLRRFAQNGMRVGSIRLLDSRLGWYSTTMVFPIEIDREDDGRWLAEVPALPGVLCYGADRDEAVARVQALALRVIAERLEHRETPAEFVNVTFRAA